MKRKFKQWWSTIPSISTKRTTTSCLKILNIKNTTTLEIHVLVWDRHKNVVGLNWLMGSQPSSISSRFWCKSCKSYSVPITYRIMWFPRTYSQEKKCLTSKTEDTCLHWQTQWFLYPLVTGPLTILNAPLLAVKKYTVIFSFIIWCLFIICAYSSPSPIICKGLHWK
jgi:hypothetical protein